MKFNHNFKFDNQSQFQLGLNIILLLIQVISVPLLQGNYSPSYIDLQYNSILVLIICSILYNCLQIEIFKLNYENKQSEEILNYQILDKEIIPLINLSNDRDYSIKDLFSCLSHYHLFKLFVSNPKLAILNFIDALTYQIYLNTKSIINIDGIELIINLIDTRNKKYFDGIIQNGDLKMFEDFVIELKNFQLKNIIFLKLYDKEGNLYDQKQFIDKIRKLREVQDSVRSKQYKLDKCNFIQNIQDYKVSQNQIQNSENIMITNDQSFLTNISIMCLVNKQKIEKTYNSLVDSVLHKLYYSSLSNIINIKNQKSLSTNTEFIWSLLEKKLKITRKDKENTNDQLSFFQYKDTYIEYITRVAKDKSMDLISSKINRKYKNHTIDNIPYFINLIKDFKRMSLVFDNTKDLKEFLILIQNNFGKFWSQIDQNQNQNINQKIIEIKNNLQNDSIDVTYRDLKIIFEVQQIDYDQVLRLEVQCSVKKLIQWKKSDHIMQEFIRIDQSIENFQNQLSDYQYFESTFFKILKITRELILLFVMSSAFSVIIQNCIIYIQNYKKILCQRGDLKCHNNCIQNKEHSNFECIYYQTNYNQKLSISDKILQCNKFYQLSKIIYDDCQNETLLIDLKLKDGINELCYMNKSKLISCVDNKLKMRNVEQTNIFEFQGENQIYNQDNKIHQEINKLTEFKSDFTDILNNIENISQIKIKEYQICLINNEKVLLCNGIIPKIKQIAMNNDTICILQDFLECNIFGISQYFRQNTLKVAFFQNQICLIDINFEVKCLLRDQNDSFTISDDHYENIFSSINHVCLVSLDKKIFCFGVNNFGECDVPNLQDEVSTLSLTENVSCLLQNNGIVICWGNHLLDQINEIKNQNIKSFSISINLYAFIYNDHTANVYDVISNDIQFQKLSDISQVSTGQFNFCVININQILSCQGDNNNSQLSFPSQLTNSRQVICHTIYCCSIAINDLFGCWNESVDVQKFIESIPYKLILNKSNIVLANYDYYICYNTAQNGNSILECLLDFNTINPQEQRYYYIIENFEYEYISSTKQQICYVKKDLLNTVYCIDTIKVSEPFTLDQQKDINVQKILGGEFYICFLLTNQKLNCYGTNLSKINSESINVDIYDFLIGQNRICILNFNLKIICQYVNELQQLMKETNKDIYQLHQNELL